MSRLTPGRSMSPETYKIKKNICADDAKIISPHELIEKKYDIEKSLRFQIDEAANQGVQKFYISFYWQYDPVISGMMGTQQDDNWVPAYCDNFTSVATMACPTPHYNQLVYKYDHGHIEALWFIPSLEEFNKILSGEMEASPEIKFWVHSAHTGDLFKFIDKENNEDTYGKRVLIVDPDTLT